MFLLYFIEEDLQDGEFGLGAPLDPLHFLLEVLILNDKFIFLEMAQGRGVKVGVAALEA